MEEKDNEGQLADQEEDSYSDNAAGEVEGRNERSDNSSWEVSYFDSSSVSEDEWYLEGMNTFM